MLACVGGLPGSGKSYYAANYIAEKFGRWNELYQEYFFSDQMLIFTNIEGFRLEHKTLESCFQKYGGMENFFTIPNFEKIREVYPHHKIIVIIDEAQTFFPAAFKNQAVEFFFEYHRHVGLSIFLLSNAIPKLKKTIVGLSESIIEAQPRTLGLPGVFRYKFRDIEGTYLRSEVVKLKKSVFSIYKSFTTDEHDKPKNVIKHWLVVAAIMCIVTVIGFKSFAGMYSNRGKHKDVPVVQKSVPVQSRVSSAVLNRVADNKQSMLPVPPVIMDMLHPPVQTWRKYAVDGFIDAGLVKRYIINGFVVEGRNCKNYDKELRTVDYYGFEIPERRLGKAEAQESTAQRSDSAAVHDNKEISIGTFRNFSTQHLYKPKHPPF